MGLKDSMKKMSHSMDITCDKCGKLMKPGGVVKKHVDGADHQFCSPVCANAFRHGDKTR